jgi:hypothetical protein
MFMVTLRSKLATGRRRTIGTSAGTGEFGGHLNLAPFEFGLWQLYDFTAIRIPQVVGRQQAVLESLGRRFRAPPATPSDRD